MKVHATCVCLQGGTTGIGIPDGPGSSSFTWQACAECPNRNASGLTVGELRSFIKDAVAEQLVESRVVSR